MPDLSKGQPSTETPAARAQATEMGCPFFVLKPEALTRREKEVLTYAALGFTALETAARLILTERTIKGYLATAQLKLGARNKAHAVAIALVGQFIKLDTKLAHGPN